jgi:hypothetical protein
MVVLYMFLWRRRLIYPSSSAATQEKINKSSPNIILLFWMDSVRLIVILTALPTSRCYTIPARIYLLGHIIYINYSSACNDGPVTMLMVSCYELKLSHLLLLSNQLMLWRSNQPRYISPDLPSDVGSYVSVSAMSGSARQFDRCAYMSNCVLCLTISRCSDPC